MFQLAFHLYIFEAAPFFALRRLSFRKPCVTTSLFLQVIAQALRIHIRRDTDRKRHQSLRKAAGNKQKDTKQTKANPQATPESQLELHLLSLFSLLDFSFLSHLISFSFFCFLSFGASDTSNDKVLYQPINPIARQSDFREKGC